MVSGQEIDQEWAKLAALDADAREPQMAARYTELLTKPEEEQKAMLRAMARAEYSLPDAQLRAFTLSRMRTWIDLDDEKARAIAQAYDGIMQDMPAEMAMRRVFLVQTLVRDFTAEEEERLRELVPRVFAGAPSRTTVLGTEPSMRIETKKKKPFWAFWKKD